MSKLRNILSKNKALLITAGLFLLVITFQHIRNKNILQDAYDIINQKESKLETERNEKGELTARALAMEIEVNTLKNINNDLTKNLKKEIGNIRNLISTIEIKNATIRDSVTTLLRDSTVIRISKHDSTVIDTFRYKSFAYRDDFTDIDGLIFDDSVSIDYSVRSDMRVTAYRDREWFLGKKYTKFSFYSNNPNLSIDGLQPIIVKDEKKWHETRAFNLLLGAFAGFATSNLAK